MDSDAILARLDALDATLTARLDHVDERLNELQADIEIRFATVRDEISTMNTNLSTVAAVLARHLQDHP